GPARHGPTGCPDGADPAVRPGAGLDRGRHPRDSDGPDPLTPATRRRPMVDPTVREWDLINLTVLVFLPAAVAGLILLVPGRFKESMRWLAVIGTAATLTLGLCRLIDY